MTHDDETVERELLREALEALQVFAAMDGDLTKTVSNSVLWTAETISDETPGSTGSSTYVKLFDPFTMGDLRRARAAADKIRAALEHQQKGEEP